MYDGFYTQNFKYISRIHVCTLLHDIDNVLNRFLSLKIWYLLFLILKWLKKDFGIRTNTLEVFYHVWGGTSHQIDLFICTSNLYNFLGSLSN